MVRDKLAKENGKIRDTRAKEKTRKTINLER